MQAIHEIPTFHQNSEGFLNYLRGSDDASKSLSPERLSEVFSVDFQTLAAQAHVHRNTISRAPTSAGVQRYLREAVRVIYAAIDISGDVERAIFWYRNAPIAPFDYKTAEELVSEGRTEDLIRYIQSLEAGALG